MNSFNTKNPELFYPAVHSDQNYMLNCTAYLLMIADNSYSFDFN